MDAPETEQVTLNLKARTSRIKGQPGIVRIHESQLAKVDFEHGDQVELVISRTVKKKDEDKVKEFALIVKVMADKLMRMGYASVREEDMRKLDLRDDDAITLRSYKKYSESLKEGYHKVKDKVKESLKKKKEEEEEEEETE